MKVVQSSTFRAQTAWEALDIANLDGITVRLHWTDRPYHWHINDGKEVFAVLQGEVDMHYKLKDNEQVTRLSAGDIFYAEMGEEHFARPIGEARILVIERAGSE